MIWTDKAFTPDPALTVKLFDTPEGPYLISQKQLEIMQACREPNGHRKLIFTASEKWTGKTFGCLDAIVDLAFNVEHSNIAIITHSIGAGDDSGVWTKLTKETIPQWIAGDFGLEWWMGGARPRAGSRQKGASKKIICSIKNKFGGESCFELNSLQMERDVEALFFSRDFSALYWCELQNYKERKSFDTLIQSLRVASVPAEHYVMLCDGNPSEQGKRAWQYKLWFEDRINPDLPEEQKPLQKNLKLITLTLDDNPFLTDERKAEIKASYAHDANLYARYILGEWVEASTDSLFVEVFKPAIHVVGDIKDTNPDVLVPSEGVMTLYTGWDFGMANPAVVFFEQTFPPEWQVEPKPKHGLSRFHFFSEICFLGVKHGELSLASFTELVMLEQAYWERLIGHPVEWVHFSDRSVMDTSQVIENRLQHTEVMAASGGKIELIAVDRRPGTVSAAIRFWQQLLFQQRILISAERCPALIAAQTGLTKARGPTGPIPYSIAKGNIHKHPWDAARYGVTYLCWEEMMRSIDDLNTIKKSEMRIISVPI